MAARNAGLEAALLHYELIVAALQSHERLAKIEDEYQGRLSAFWDEAHKYTADAVAKETAGLQKENARLARKVRAFEEEAPRAHCEAQGEQVSLFEKCVLALAAGSCVSIVIQLWIK